jgi:hypothetical protein
MKKLRFEVRENTPNSFGIYDNDAKEYHRLIDTAVSIYMRREAAETIAEIINREWIYFLAHPPKLRR